MSFLKIRLESRAAKRRRLLQDEVVQELVMDAFLAGKIAVRNVHAYGDDEMDSKDYLKQIKK